MHKAWTCSALHLHRKGWLWGARALVQGLCGWGPMYNPSKTLTLVWPTAPPHPGQGTGTCLGMSRSKGAMQSRVLGSGPGRQRDLESHSLGGSLLHIMFTQHKISCVSIDPCLCDFQLRGCFITLPDSCFGCEGPGPALWQSHCNAQKSSKAQAVPGQPQNHFCSGLAAGTQAYHTGLYPHHNHRVERPQSLWARGQPPSHPCLTPESSRA